MGNGVQIERRPFAFDLPHALIFVAVCLAVAALSALLALPVGHGAAMALTGGVYLATLLLVDKSQWRHWTVLAFVVEAAALWGIHDHAWPAALGDAFGHTAGMLLAAWLTHRYGAHPCRLSTLREVLLLCLFIALPGAAVSATIECLLAWQAEGGTSLTAWLRHWTSCLGGVAVAPVILTLVAARGQSALWAAGRRVEAALLLLALALATHVIFSSRLPMVFFLLPFLVWVALRFDMPGMSIALLVMVVTALAHTAAGLGPYADPAYAPDTMAILVQLYVYVAVCGGLVLSVVMTQRRQILDELRLAQTELEQRVQAGIATVLERERSLRENEERFRLARAAARIIVIDWDIARDKLTFSDSPEWFRGPLPPSGVYPLFKDQVHAEDRVEFLRLRQQALDTLQGYTVQFRMVRTDGVVLHIQSYRTVIAGADGKAERIVAIHQDVTEWRQAEQALRESEARLRTLLDAIPDQVRLKDTQRRYVMVNRAAREFMRLTDEQIIGRTIFDLRPREIAERIDADDNAMMAVGKPNRIERPSYFVPGVWREEITAPINDAEGRLTGIVSISRDITERKKAELDALREREARYRTLVEQASDWIYRTDPRGYFTYSNATATDMLGYTRDELIGKHYSHVVRADHVEQTQRFYARQFHERIPTTYREIPALTKDGRTVWVGQHVQLVCENNWVLYYQAVCRDITDRVAAQQALSESNDKLRRMALRQEELLEAERVRIAHDLHDGIGQSLHLARIKLSTLPASADAPERQRALDEVVRTIDETSSVIRTLEFDLSPPVLRELGLEPALEWLAEQMLRIYGLRVSISSDGEPKPLDQLQRAVVFRAVRELLINIARHAATHDAHVDTQREQARLVVTVSDEGAGFDVASTTAKGLGLTGMQERFTQLGGNVRVVSARGSGTVVTLSLPLGAFERRIRR